MKEFFEKIKEQENSTFQKSEQTWWNGNAFHPLIKCSVRYPHLDGEIKINYEFRQSEFSKPPKFDSGAFSDQHIYSFLCLVNVKKPRPNFDIYERSLFSKLFKRNPTSFYVVNCKDLNFLKILENNKNLKSIFKLAENSSRFSPSINGEMLDSFYQLEINFTTQNNGVLESINEFCQFIIEILNNKKNW